MGRKLVTDGIGALERTFREARMEKEAWKDSRSRAGTADGWMGIKRGAVAAI
jgi:hypothetical protein